MAQTTWEKPKVGESSLQRSNRLQFILAGEVLLGTAVYLIVSGTATGSCLILTVEEIPANQNYIDQTARVSGAVIGDSIEYYSQSLILDFTIAHIPVEYEDLAQTLHEAVTNPNATCLAVHLENEIMPDLLQQEAQTILTGEIGEDGIFYVGKLLPKCPSSFEESVPRQVLEVDS